ncbi:MAG: GIDE domain-containing protein [Haloarculaceae archaeon]
MIGGGETTLWVVVTEVTGHLVPLATDSGNEGELLIALVGGFFFGLYLVYDGFNKWQTKRLIQDTPTETIRSMAVGRTELDGVAKSVDDTVEAPFTDEECLHIDWEIEEWRKDTNDDDYHWETIARGVRSVPFYLDDGTGKVPVRATEGDPTYEISDANRWRTTVGRGRSPPTEVREFIQRHDSRYDDTSFFEEPVDALTDLVQSEEIGSANRKRRYSQTILPDGSSVYLLGSAIPRDSAEGGQDESLLEITRTESLDKLLVSDRSEDELESYYSKRGPLEVVGGLALSAICLGVLLLWFTGGL